MRKQLLLFTALLIASIGLSAQTFIYSGKALKYSKFYDTAFVTVNDAKKTVLKFPKGTAMPTAVQVLAEYKRVMTAPPVIIPPVVVPPVTPPASGIVWTVIKLNSNEMNLGDISGKNIKFAAGTNTPWAISFSGNNVKIDGSYFGESDGLSLYVNGGSNIEIVNFKWKKHTYRPVNIGPWVKDGLWIHNCSFKNVDNSVISNDIRDNDIYFDGTESTVFKNWKIENNYFENTSTVFSAGGGIDTEKKKLINVFKYFKFNNNTIKGGGGNVVTQLIGEDNEIANNQIDGHNMNSLNYAPGVPNGPHNRIFNIIGVADIHDNFVKNHQGNAFAISPANIFGTLKESKVYNNTVYNSWKYSMIELQTYPYQWDFINSIKGTPNEKFFSKGAVKIYNNTTGKLNVSKDWEGQFLDLYGINATLSVYNNVAFDLNRSNGNTTTDMINYNGNSNPVVNPSGMLIDSPYYYGNRYFSDWTKAVKDLVSFESLTPGVGAPKK